MLATASAGGQVVPVDDGCAVLEKLVQARVQAAAMPFRDGAGGLSVRRVPADRAGMAGSVAAEGEVCSATVQVATGAFSRALARLDIAVTWDFTSHPGDFCWSGDLSQCYPSEDPTVPALPPHQLAFVRDAWNGVRSAISAQMPRGPAGGIAHFTAVSLDAALSTNLQATLHGPLHGPLHRAYSRNATR